MSKKLLRPTLTLIGNLRQSFRLSSKASKKPIALTDKPDARRISQDYIGPPDKLSNLRPYVRCIPENETPLAQRLREQRINVEAWNQDFWSRHNKRFYDEREDFIRLHREAGNNEVPADQMSKFYKSFLDKNRKLHLLYNISWYIKNFDLLVLAAMVSIQKLLPKRFNKQS